MKNLHFFKIWTF